MRGGADPSNCPWKDAVSSPPPTFPTRSPRARTLERVVNRLLGALGGLLGRPDEGLLQALTGRARGGPGADPQAALARGRAALAAQDYAEALHQLRLAHEAAPEDPWPLHGRGDALQLSGDPAGALAAYEAALAVDPGLALSHSGRGNALEALGRRDEARAAWEQALALDPSLPWARQGLARLAR